MSTCIDCGVTVGLRRNRCPEHRKAHRAKLERDRVARNREAEAPRPRPKRSEPEVVIDGELVDYTRQSARPSIAQFDTQYKPRPMASMDDDPVIDYTQGGQPRPSLYDQPRRAKGHDYTEALRSQYAQEYLESLPQQINWNDLAGVQHAYESNRQHDLPISGWLAADDKPGPRYDYLGRPQPRNRGRRERGLR